MAVKYGPTKGEYIFRICCGFMIFVVAVAGVFVRGMPTGLVAIEMFIFGGGFATYLIGMSAYRIATKAYRIL